MIERDQKMRKLFMKKRSNWNANVDMKNTEKLKKIINKYGWPGKSLVGEKAADAAWLIAQHADHDVKFQEKCLCLIKKAVKIGEASKKNLAYLIDRMLVKNRKKQIYGTQFRYESEQNLLKPYLIRDKKNLARRRKNAGLESFTVNMKRLRLNVGLNKKNKRKNIKEV
ncbi:MAG: hypothetical protein UU18_C0034G0005 [Parcubacteria group bacterium GW2011_GWB2_40_8]|nr:MAG: hypothetical protein UU18_C0034G0005 [Parcubacteria group bacterium GW2011_GWB2_40_8]KKR75306.1 MAG: hypothetical protein UU20_C0057G0004 [Parcubacteria group bacterium GW2011_GWE2_40_8]